MYSPGAVYSQLQSISLVSVVLLGVIYSIMISAITQLDHIKMHLSTCCCVDTLLLLLLLLLVGAAAIWGMLAHMPGLHSCICARDSNGWKELLKLMQA